MTSPSPIRGFPTVLCFCAFTLFLLTPMASGAAQAVFRAPQQLPTTLTTNQWDNTAPSLFSDDRTMYFSTDRPGGLGSKSIWEITRSGWSAPWSGLKEIRALNSSVGDFSLDVTDDGLEAFVTSLRPGGVGGTDLWHFKRQSITQPWGPPTNFPFNTPKDQDDPTIRSDGLEIFWVALEQISTTVTKTYSIYRATRPTRTSTVWTNHGPVPEFNLFPWIDHSPALAPDGLTMIFGTDRRGGTGSSDMYIATRSRIGAPFQGLRELKELNTPTWEKNGQWSTDGFSFYYTRDNDKDIWRADRIRPVLGFRGVLARGVLRNAQIGTTFSVFVRRDPGDVGVLALALAPWPPTSLGGVKGKLRINLAMLLAPPQIRLLNGNGRLTISLPVPKAPALRGVILYFQGAAQDRGGGNFLSDLYTVQLI